MTDTLPNRGPRWPRLLTILAVLLGSLSASTRLAESKPPRSNNELVTVTVHATIIAKTQFQDGEVSETEEAEVAYRETSVRRIVPVNSASLDVQEVSHSGLVEANGGGKMAWGSGLPVSEWTFVCRQPGRSLVRLHLKPDRRNGVVGLESFLPCKSLDVKCEGGDPEQWRPRAEATGLVEKAWSGFCQAKSLNFPSLSLPFQLDANSRRASLEHVFQVKGPNGDGRLRLECVIKVG